MIPMLELKFKEVRDIILKETQTDRRLIRVVVLPLICTAELLFSIKVRFCHISESVSNFVG